MCDFYVIGNVIDWAVMVDMCLVSVNDTKVAW